MHLLAGPCASSRGVTWLLRQATGRRRGAWFGRLPALAGPGPKRALDVLLASVLLVLLAPLFLLIACVIKLVDGGPVLHWQRRIGYRGREFWFPKFRSMHVGAEKLQVALRPYTDYPESLTFKMRRDPRLTFIGRPLRILSLDELPQLFSVLRGEMSMVGPRPPLPEEVALYSETERRRLEVKPGLTCIWQVSGRSAIPFPSQVVMDLYYIRHRDLWLDFKLLLLTIPAVLSCRGAY